MPKFMTPRQVADTYNIPRPTVYHRIRTHKYRVDQNYDVLVEDVENYEKTKNNN